MTQKEYLVKIKPIVKQITELRQLHDLISVDYLKSKYGFKPERLMDVVVVLHDGSEKHCWVIDCIVHQNGSIYLKLYCDETGDRKTFYVSDIKSMKEL